MTPDLSDVVYPMTVNNDTAIEESWPVVFTEPTTITEILGESTGRIEPDSPASPAPPTIALPCPAAGKTPGAPALRRVSQP